jgi:putative hydrolase of the HAD superfamily
LILALRAVVFDYGMVLTGPPDSAAHAELERITGLSADCLDGLYWADRHAYDEGKLTGIEFWRKIGSEAGIDLGESQIEELNRWDARMWTTFNGAMLEWQAALKERGFLTAIVSNMGDAVLEYMLTKFDWLSRFDVLVWSYQLGLAKPDPAIYRYVLEKLGTQPGETLFIDDRQDNVGAAVKLGMKGIVFTCVDRLRADLRASKLDAELPLP